MDFSPEDQQAFAAAVRRLETPSLAGRLAALAGKPVGLLQQTLPAPASKVVAKVTARALERALAIALFSLHDSRLPVALRNGRLADGRAIHSVLACASGAIGGAFGLAALAIELPISTTIMLRAIAAIAQHEGENLADQRTGLACLEVFALGNSPASGERDYFATRALLDPGAIEIADFALEKSALQKGAPALVEFLTQIASRFGIVVSEKLAAQAVAVVGAFGGAAVNLAFIEHFQDLARGHFTVRRLERVYGPDLVRAEYERLKAACPAAA
jgi:EcsC family protein